MKNSKVIDRYLSSIAFSEEFGRQMRFITGPRQAGKTTMAKSVLTGNKETYYFNWDEKTTKDLYRNNPAFLSAAAAGKGKPWICFDEIHKMPKWKNILKGLFDGYEERLSFIVTGSAKLDTFRKSGDSLAGRYFVFTLNPVISSELAGMPLKDIMPEPDGASYVEKIISREKSAAEAVDAIIEHTGFPEPLLKSSGAFSRKWHDSYFERIIKEDMRDLTMIRHLEKVADLIYLLPARVGSPLSVNALREDLEMNFHTISSYISGLSVSYALFNLPPFTGNMKRLVKKERKFYLYDFDGIKNEGARFENFCALELKSRVDLWNDSGADRFALNYLRTKDGKETDFLIVKNNRPYVLFESKISDTPIEPHHRSAAAALGGIPFVQIIRKPKTLRAEGSGIFSVSADRLFA